MEQRERFARSRQRIARFASAAALLTGVVGVSSMTPASADPFVVTDLTSTTPPAMAQTLEGAGVTIDPSSVDYTGLEEGGGTFSGGSGIIGFDSGIILSSGWAKDVVGPNNSGSLTKATDSGGDADLTTLAGVPTYDQAVLEFDFTVPASSEKVFFQYTFGSEEYNEYVNSQFNDVFGFFVNGANCATVGTPAVPVAINTINNGNGNGDTTATNPTLYINNDPANPDGTGATVPLGSLANTQMDGFTKTLLCEAAVTSGTNTMKLAIADGSDQSLDSWVMIKADSITTTKPEVCDNGVDDDSDDLVDNSDPDCGTAESPAPECSATLTPDQAAAQGYNVIQGNAARNTLTGTAGPDAIFGHGENDTIRAAGGDDCVLGGDGNDYIDGGAGKDRMFGQAGSDKIDGGSEDDYLDGGNGSFSYLTGMGGIDTCVSVAPTKNTSCEN